MAVKYWDYWADSTSTATTTTPYYDTWGTGGTSSTISTATTGAMWRIYTNTQPQVHIERYVVTGFDDWSPAARAVLTRLVNDETDTGFKLVMWLLGDVEITDPSIMIRDCDWFLLRLRQVASAADYEKIANHIAQVRAEIASGTEARQRPDPEEGLDPKGDGPTLEERDAQTPSPSSRERK